MKKLFSSESVSSGHPDKICDIVSDAILDSMLKEDSEGRAAIETLVTAGMIVVSGEISTKCYIEIPKIVKNIIKDIGYVKPEYGLDYQTCAVLTTIQEQSPDIAQGVNRGGAGDQGMMFGYATDETKEYMPLPILLAHKIMKQVEKIRKNNVVKYLRPDGKAQITIEYENDIPKRIDTVVLSVQHDPEIAIETIKNDMIKYIVKEIIDENLIDDNTKYYINPTGIFTIGGPQADVGLTGRKIIVDTYGGMASHGGGCFSGKDPSKVDRSGAYIARYIAKNLVAAGIAKKMEIQIAYAIGIAEPVSIFVNTYNTSDIEYDKIIRIIRDIFDLTPNGIIEHLRLKNPIYKNTASYGHFGRNEDGFTWELLDKVEKIRRYINK